MGKYEHLQQHIASDENTKAHGLRIPIVGRTWILNISASFICLALCSSLVYAGTIASHGIFAK